MSSARLQKLKSLLARVEQRRAQPRLHAVPAVAAVSPAALDEDDESIDTEPPPALLLTEKKPTKPAASPIEDAMAKLDQSGPLDVHALAEPIAMKPAQISERPAAEPPKSDTRPELKPLELPAARAPETLSRARMSQPDPSMLDDDEPVLPPVELKPAPARSPSSVREPTLRFDTGVEAAPHAQVEIGGLPVLPKPASLVDLPPVAPAPAAPAAPVAVAPANAPSQVLEAPALDSAAIPARAVSAARVEAPKTFGELLELSLALRPR